MFGVQIAGLALAPISLRSFRALTRQGIDDAEDEAIEIANDTPSG